MTTCSGSYSDVDKPIPRRASCPVCGRDLAVVGRATNGWGRPRLPRHDEPLLCQNCGKPMSEHGQLAECRVAPDVEIGPAADIRDFTRRHGLLPAPELP